MNRIYENIRRRRLELGMSQDQLARLCGYSDRSAVNHIEKGKINLPYDKIIAFAKALEIEPEDLLGYEEQNDLGELLDDIRKDNVLCEYIRKIYALPPVQKKSVYDYVDFINRE